MRPAAPGKQCEAAIPDYILKKCSEVPATAAPRLLKSKPELARAANIDSPQEPSEDHTHPTSKVEYRHHLKSATIPLTIVKEQP